MEWIEAEPKPGDPVRTKVKFYYHYGIFVSPDSVIQFGLPDAVTRPAEEIRVISTDVYTFLCGGTLEVGKPDRAERKQLRPSGEIIALARSRLGEDGYDLLHNNCEHFMNDCLFGEKRSSMFEDMRAKLRQKLGKES